MAAFYTRAPGIGFATRASVAITQALAILWSVLVVGFLSLIAAGFLVAGLRM